MVTNMRRLSQFSGFHDLNIELSALKITDEKSKRFIFFTSALQKPLRLSQGEIRG